VTRVDNPFSPGRQTFPIEAQASQVSDSAQSRDSRWTIKPFASREWPDELILGLSDPQENGGTAGEAPQARSPLTSIREGAPGLEEPVNTNDPSASLSPQVLEESSLRATIEIDEDVNNERSSPLIATPAPTFSVSREPEESLPFLDISIKAADNNIDVEGDMDSAAACCAVAVFTNAYSNTDSKTSFMKFQRMPSESREHPLHFNGEELNDISMILGTRRRDWSRKRQSVDIENSTAILNGLYRQRVRK